MIAPSDLLVPHTAPLAVNCHIVIEVPENMHHVRFGSLADISQRNRHVRFAPESGHVQCKSRCLLSANSGHCASTEMN
jgi:hypothetical protein